MLDTERRTKSPYPGPWGIRLTHRLYNNPAFEHDGCGTGFIASINGERTHRIVELAVRSVVNLTHRGAVAADAHFGKP